MRARGTPITVAVFLSGAVLLGLEIAASRVLAPFFGNSLYVWGALIGVVLAGLAIGYWVGGTLADRFPRPGLLVGAILLGAAGVLAVPFADEPVLELVVDWDPGPRADPVVASILLFGAPSIVLAAVTPIAVRLRADSVERMGRTAGRLFSVSTIGSIVGTFAAAFWLIPELGTDQVIAVGAAVLFAAAGVVAISERLAVGSLLAVGAAAAAVVAVVSLAPETGGTLSEAAARNWSPVYRLRGDPASLPEVDYSGLTVVYRKDTRYHQLAVVEDFSQRTLRFGSSYQSAMFLAEPFDTPFTYIDYLFLGPAYKPDMRSVLFLGLGGGSAPKKFLRVFPELQLDVVELDPVVVDVAHRYFALPRDPHLHIEVADARRYLAKTDRRWDVLAVDTFFEDGIPFHLATREFVQLLHSRLTPGGVVVANIIGAMQGDGSKLFRAIYRTYRSVFPTVLVHPVNGPDGGVQNLILVATDQAAPSKRFLADRWRKSLVVGSFAPELTSAIPGRFDGVIPTRDVPILTDGYAPTEALLLE